MILTEIFKKALDGGYAIGQFNVSNLEQIRAICEVAKALQSPLILGTSEGERKFIGLKQITAIAKVWQEETGLPIIVNADHSRSFETAKTAYDAGYTGIHFDGSEFPYEENLKITKRVVEYVKSKNPDVIVEGELGRVRGSSEVHNEAIVLRESDFTDPDLAMQFIKESGVDSLAISYGNIHGVFGVSHSPRVTLGELHGEEVPKDGPWKTEKLDIERLKDIREKAGAFLVLHGGSGISAIDVKESIKNGIVKVNINTELRVAYVNTLREFLNKSEETTPYKIWPAVIEAVKKVVEEKMRLFGSINKI
ncbi:MAG: tagatose-bisphosphate aldolase [Candidatus Tagabacteria bacterium CG_4_10_14_0_2_um_filter_40_13]|uniref:Tagatose-bisphosphate aldolase n=3 Tax=Candidatus Tagaibacteriota TaxID=1817918 RepID=A0A2M8G8S6_9BACT|nr:MAG: tagatose-bisphosphate aldolase [Candidatus Tagabacteria bacterium CG11_big_fil_rev_8_21_14_0_20_41_11]PIU99412.1 MAG: tagatose-bisphosphate aldolase [Candidatus Tagabacteria bacterium CG03_land_8_20_14_0_80_41_22]PIZ56669.1 MAG: tagatose-bisphosphate aldolase [Candidatus Tagabacteria bacterium CG_4_10_14_0_2_um_filter_40_13]PJC25042.1 MAG: tagatose-bisphosphate aldolase [Candidatus Tagabacteria bacterium CG_4_9_14_0_2_um_filter_41_11]PJC69815.1 MAG: tagatose-bisphosphate aldolase [Candi